MGGQAKVDYRVLVVEDDPDLRASLTYSLTAAGFIVRSSETGTAALTVIRPFDPDIVLLDLVLPDMRGTEVFKSLRENSSGRAPAVVILGPNSDEIDRVVCFELGADDYVIKPFSFRELILRIRAILRSRIYASRRSRRSGGRLVVGPLEIDVDRHRVSLNGENVAVTRNEMRLLVHLVENCDRVCSREKLLEQVWHYGPGVSSRTIDIHVGRLRRKLGGGAALFQTVRGVGYLLSADSPTDSGQSRERSPRTRSARLAVSVPPPPASVDPEPAQSG